jgi:drug/metabolite transporter (DMT)-like permease
VASTDIRGVTRAATSRIWGPLAAVWLLWGSTYLGIAVMGRTLPPLVGNGLRFGTACLVVALIVLIRWGPRALLITRAELRSTAIMGVALLVAVMPLWIILFRVRAGERPAGLTLVGVAVGLAGLVFMLLPGGTEPVAGDDRDVVIWSVAILVSSFSWAFFSWRSAGYSLPGNPMVTTTYEMAFAAAALVVVGTVTGERVQLELIDPSSFGAMAWLVTASVVGYTAYTWLIRNAPMSLVATYAYVNPVVAVFLGWLIISEPITRDVVLGLTVVVGGVVLVVTGERRT